MLHLEFRVQFWLLHSCVQFAVSAEWEAQGKRVLFPIGELDKIDLMFVCKVGDILLVEFKVGEV